MRRTMFGVLAVAVMCVMATLPAAAQQSAPITEVNIFPFGRSSASTDGVSFPRGMAFGIELEIPAIPNRLTMSYGLRHEGTGKVRVAGFDARVSRTYFETGFRFYPVGQGRVRPYGLFGMGIVWNKFHSGNRSQNQNAAMISLGGGVKFDITKKWAIAPEGTLTHSGGARDYYGNKAGGGVTSKALWVALVYKLS